MEQDKQLDAHQRLLEQYKLYVEMADRMSARRADTSKFYISLLTGLLVVLSVVFEKNLFTTLQNHMLLAVGLLGLALCIVWVINISSYSQLSAGKFRVIHEMEQDLPFPCYKREWDLLGQGAKRAWYLQITQVEQVVPFLLALPYLFLFAYALSTLVG